jgi:(1->4)-alpha-D-glucan 1-alpha-D-glucosylmutase
MTLTSSHDTKRSEDARMRIAAITSDPAAFVDFFRACSEVGDGAVGANLRWYLAQTVLAMAGEPDLAARLETHVEKALREAKRATFWNAPNAEVERAAQAFARRLAERFSSLPGSLSGILARAEDLVLVQTALKLTVPGIPDIYQGSERTFFALTDPDNRRAVDFEALAAGLADPAALPTDLDRKKLSLTRALLRLRRAEPALFLDGSHAPEEVPEGLAFVRRLGGMALRVHLRTDGGTVPSLEGRPVWPETPGTDTPVRVTLVREQERPPAGT